MNQKETLLAASLLAMASEEYNDHGCNDWNFPTDWTEEEKTAFVKEYHAYNGDQEEFSPNHLHLPDFAVMSFMAHKLRKEAA